MVRIFGYLYNRDSVAWPGAYERHAVFLSFLYPLSMFLFTVKRSKTSIRRWGRDNKYSGRNRIPLMSMEAQSELGQCSDKIIFNVSSNLQLKTSLCTIQSELTQCHLFSKTRFIKEKIFCWSPSNRSEKGWSVYSGNVIVLFIFHVFLTILSNVFAINYIISNHK